MMPELDNELRNIIGSTIEHNNDMGLINEFLDSIKCDLSRPEYKFPIINQKFTNKILYKAEFETIIEILKNTNTINKKYKDDNGFTILHMIVYSHHKLYDHLELLLQNGADPNIRDSSGKTPIFYAHYVQIGEILLKYGAKLNILNSRGKTPFYCAIERHYYFKWEFIDFLIKKGVKLDLDRCKKSIFKAAQDTDKRSKPYLDDQKMVYKIKIALVLDKISKRLTNDIRKIVADFIFR